MTALALGLLWMVVDPGDEPDMAFLRVKILTPIEEWPAFAANIAAWRLRR